MDWRETIRPEFDGMKPYEPGLRASEVRQRTGREDVLKLSSNEYPDGPFPRALEAMAAVLPRLNRYPDGSVRALRARLSLHWGVDERFISVSSGSNELLRLIGQVVLRPGDEVVYAWPSFVVYPTVARMFGATPVEVPLSADLRHDLPAMLAAVTERTRVLFLCNPNNPTGTIYSRDEFDAFLAQLPVHVLLVIDEAYFEFVDDASFPDGLTYFDGERPIVVLRTFSKIYSLAGVRVGYGFMPTALKLAIDTAREPFNVNTVGQVGAYHSLEDPAELGRRRAENIAQKDLLYAAFDRLGIGYVRSHTNFIWFKASRPGDVFDALLAEGVIARGFGPAPALRLTMGTAQDTPQVVAAFENVVSKLGTL
jgi:histidinol-phosphate aminotransferase